MSAAHQKEHAAVKRAIRRGDMSRPVVCESCAAGPDAGLGWHHWDYSKPLDVIGLCRSCHTRVHAGSIPEPGTGRIYTRAPRPPRVRRSDVRSWKAGLAFTLRQGAEIRRAADAAGLTIGGMVRLVILEWLERQGTAAESGR